MDRRIDRQTDRRTDGQTDSRTDGHTDSRCAGLGKGADWLRKTAVPRCQQEANAHFESAVGGEETIGLGDLIGFLFIQKYETICQEVAD
jgi:hypothetical protein